VLAGCHPFDAEGCSTPEEMVKAIRTGEPSFAGEEWATVSPGAVELVKGLLALTLNPNPDFHPQP